MSLCLSPISLYRQTTDCTEGGGLTREHCTTLHLLVLVFYPTFEEVENCINTTITIEKLMGK